MSKGSVDMSKIEHSLQSENMSVKEIELAIETLFCKKFKCNKKRKSMDDNTTLESKSMDDNTIPKPHNTKRIKLNITNYFILQPELHGISFKLPNNELIAIKNILSTSQEPTKIQNRNITWLFLNYFASKNPTMNTFDFEDIRKNKTKLLYDEELDNLMTEGPLVIYDYKGKRRHVIIVDGSNSLMGIMTIKINQCFNKSLLQYLNNILSVNGFYNLKSKNFLFKNNWQIIYTMYLYYVTEKFMNSCRIAQQKSVKYIKKSLLNIYMELLENKKSEFC